MTTFNDENLKKLLFEFAGKVRSVTEVVCIRTRTLSFA